MRQAQRDECWNIIWKSINPHSDMFSDGLTLAQQDRINKALSLAYKFGKKSSK